MNIALCKCVFIVNTLEGIWNIRKYHKFIAENICIYFTSLQKLTSSTDVLNLLASVEQMRFLYAPV